MSGSMMHQPKPPSILWAVGVSAVIGVLGVVAFIGLLFTSIFGLGDRMTQHVMPGSHTLQLDEPGTYTIFHEYQSVVNGTRYGTSPNDIQTLTCEVVQVGAAGSAEMGIPVVPPSANMNYNLMERSGYAIFQFTINQPGSYRFSAFYPNEDGPETVLAVSLGFMGDLLFAILGCFAILIVTGIAITAVMLFAVFKRSKAQAHPPLRR